MRSRCVVCMGSWKRGEGCRGLKGGSAVEGEYERDE